ncbi:MAG TPA: M14 metallopeptidase family protein [Longimicrobiales bacterium]|nr:M14 metallopeptidase family protein [Longimicrobiales bacterium]
MKPHPCQAQLLAAAAAVLLAAHPAQVSAARAPQAAPPAAAAPARIVPSPEEFFGHRMGADRQLARWDRLVAYYDTLAARSDRVWVEEMGPSTLGNPFLVVFVSSPANLANLETIRRRNAVLQDPRGHSEQEIEDAIANGRAIVVQGYGLHSNEVAGTQSAAEFVYLLATGRDERTMEILDNTLSIVIPNMNPDGNLAVTDWYRRWVGTEYEGAPLPELYHTYAGHDNNRDAIMQNTVESRYVAEILFREWIPQAFVDHHQMGSYGPRIYLPPYTDPIRPGADPLVWREMAWYGAHMAYRMEEAGLPGAITDALYSGWGHFGFHWIAPFHNIAGMLTESAGARMASPLFVHPDQLRDGRGLPEHEAQTDHPSPWQGGWWRLRDVVERQIVASLATLEIAAKNRETVLRNAYNKASRQIERGAAGEVRAYVIPAEQHDALAMQKLINALLGQGITVEQAFREFQHEGRVYGEGTYVVSMEQPKQGVVRWLLGRTRYPDNTFTRERDGEPIAPYDMATDNLAEFMGVDVVPVRSPVRAELALVTDSVDPSGTIAAGANGYVLDGRANDAYEAVNRLLAAGAPVRRAARGGQGFEAGDFLVGPATDRALVAAVVEETGVDFTPLEVDAEDESWPLEPQRIGVFQRLRGGNIDEGWTRWVLEEFGFEYRSLRDRDILRGDLADRWDVIVLPADSKEMMTGEGLDEAQNEAIPPEYRSGFGEEGVAALEEFVEEGGTLVTFAQAGDLVLDAFDVPVRDVVADTWGNDFWSPGSTLRVRVDPSDPLTLGMPEEALATFLRGGQVYETLPGPASVAVRRLVTYPERDILGSGWLLGEDAIAGRAAMVAIDKGRGTVVMIGFRPQHRGQTHGTFKLFFNALLSRPPRDATRAQGPVQDS